MSEANPLIVDMWPKKFSGINPNNPTQDPSIDYTPADDSLSTQLDEMYNKQRQAGNNEEIKALLDSLAPQPKDATTPDATQSVSPDVPPPDPADIPPSPDAAGNLLDQIDVNQNTGVVTKVLRGTASVAGTVLNNAADVPFSAAIHGPMSAVNAGLATLDEMGADHLGNMLETAMPIGGFRLEDVNGKTMLNYITPEELAKDKALGNESGPRIPEGVLKFFGPRTMTGEIASDVGQFVTSFWMGGKVIPRFGKAKGLVFARDAARTVYADFTAFQAHEDRLSNLIEHYPALKNPVTEFLQADKETPALLDRTKNALEGSLTAPLVAGLLFGLRQLRAYRGKQSYEQYMKTINEAVQAQPGYKMVDELYTLLHGTKWEGKIYRGGEMAAADFAGSTPGGRSQRFFHTVKEGAAFYLGGKSGPIHEFSQFNLNNPIMIYDDTMPKLAKAEPAPPAGGTVKSSTSTVDLAEVANKYGIRSLSYSQILRAFPKEVQAAGKRFKLDQEGMTSLEHGDFANLDTDSISEIMFDVVDHTILPRLAKMGKYDSAVVVPNTSVASMQADAKAAGGGSATPLLAQPDIEVIQISDPRLKPKVAVDALAKTRRGIKSIDQAQTVEARFDPDTLLGDPAAPLISDKPSGALVKLRQILQDASNKDYMNPDELKTVAAGAEPIVMGKEPVYINFAHINSDTDLKQVIQYLSNKAKDSIATARRGTASWEETASRASQLDGWDMVLERRTGQAMNAEELLAMRELWIGSGDRVFRLAQQAAKNPTIENVYAARKMTAIFQMINDQVLGATAEAGRTLNILKKPVGVDKAYMARYISQALESVGGLEHNADFFRNLANDANQPDAYARLAEKTKSSTMSKIMGGVQDFWIGGSLLTGPKTLMRNAISNLSVMINEAMERQVAGMVDSALGNVDGVATGEGIKYLTGALSDIKQAGIAAGRAAYRNESAFGRATLDINKTRLTSKGTMMEGTPIGWAIDALGMYSSLSTRGLVATDDMFKTMNSSGEISSLVHREVTDEVRRGVIDPTTYRDRAAELFNNPTPEMLAEAHAQAHYATFTNPPGDITKAILKIIAKHPTLRFIGPFVSTPANLFKYSIDRSPLGLVSERYKRAIDAGGAQASVAKVKIGMGTMVTLGALDLALEGRITGDAGSLVTDKGQQEWLQRNNQPFSLRIDNGDGTSRMFSFQGSDPLGLTLGTMAMIGEASRLTKDNDLSEADAEALAQAGVATMFYAANYATSRSYMTGYSDFMQGVLHPGSYGETWAKKFASSFVPNWMAEANRAMDPVMRDASNTANAIARKFLFMSKGLPAMLDRFGRERTYSSGLPYGYDTWSPFYSKSIQMGPWEKEEQRQGFYVGPPSQSMTIDKVRFDIGNNPEIYQDLKRIRGTMKPANMGNKNREAQKLMRRYGNFTLLELLDAMASGNHKIYLEYSGLEDGKGNDKDRMVDRIVRDYTDAARTVLRDKYPEIDAMREKAARALKRKSENVQ